MSAQSRKAVSIQAPSAAAPSGGASPSASASASANLGDSLTLATWPNYHDQ